MSLGRQAATSFGWMAVATLGTSVMAAAQLVVAARVLAPAEMGILTQFTLVFSFFLILCDMGLSQLIIFRRDCAGPELSGLFVLSICGGVVGAGVLFFCREWIVAVLHMPSLAPFLGITAAIVAGTVPAQFARSLLERQLSFRYVAVAEVAGPLIGGSISIVLLLRGFGIWSVPLGTAINYLVQWGVVASAVGRVLRALPSPHFSGLAKSLRFGLAHTGQRALNFFLGNADFLLIGAVLGPEPLGYYAVAYNICNFLASRVNPIVGRVLFPLLTQVRDDKQRANRILLVVQDSIATFVGSPLFGLAIVAPLFVPLVIGPGWSLTGKLVTILSIVGFLRSIAGTSGPVILAYGRPDIGLRWSLLAVCLQALAIYIGVGLGGVIGAAIAFALLQVLFMPLAWWLIYRPTSGMPGKPFLQSVLPGTAIALAIAAVAYGTLELAQSHVSPWHSVLLAAATSAAAFFIGLFGFRRELLMTVRRLLTTGGTHA